jgi:broad specificity phosphatase PhoE
VKIALLVLALLFQGTAYAQEHELWPVLRKGGHVVLIRHTITEPGVGDPEGMRLNDCTTQRNLSEEGRAHARRIGAAFREFRVPVDRVLSSPWCRCVETAGLAFGGADIDESLNNLFGRRDNRETQLAAMRRLVGEPRTGANLVLVTHGSTIMALTSIAPRTGEILVVRPLGEGRFAVAGRFSVP